MSEDLTPLGALLEAARERRKLSQNAAAKKAETSGTTWRRVVKGVARFGGMDVPFDGAPDTVARMARVVGVTPEQLEQHGHADAAEELRALQPTEEPDRRPALSPVPDVPDERLDHLEKVADRVADGLAELRQGLQELREERLRKAH